MRSTSEIDQNRNENTNKGLKYSSKNIQEGFSVRIERVMISIAETPPIIPALLFIATFVIMVNMVAMGTKIRVTQYAP